MFASVLTGEVFASACLLSMTPLKILIAIANG